VSIRRGTVVWVTLSPGVGSEQTKRRPAVVVSNDAANRSAYRHGRGVITVVPLTSSRAQALPHQVDIPAGTGGLARGSVAQIEQIRAVDITRVESTGGVLDEAVQHLINRAIRVHLDLG